MDAFTNSTLGAAVSGNAIDTSTFSGYVGDTLTGGSNQLATTWGYWSNWYYPSVIRESYPVYLQDRAKDVGKQAFEIIKALQDKKLMKLDKVSDFVEAMDTLIKTL